jgi:hypothetical protein
LVRHPDDSLGLRGPGCHIVTVRGADTNEI